MSGPGMRTAAVPEGYRFVLPDGWMRLNVRDDLDEVVAGALDEIDFKSLPRDDRAKRRAAIEGRLRRALASAKRIDAHALYVPLKGMHGLAVPASFIVAEATEFGPGGDQHEVLAQLSADPGATRVLLDGSEGVRTEAQATTEDEMSGTAVPARQVSYLVAVPETSQWLLVLFDVIAGPGMDREYAAFVDALIALFDGIMTTFRWTFAVPGTARD